jgi:hypothetical protein
MSTAIKRTAVVALIAVVGPLVVTAQAHAGPPTVTTVITTGSQEPYATDFPCLPPGGTLSWHYRDVFHITDFENGVYHFGDTFYGDATFVSADGQVYTGSVVSHMSIQSNTAPSQYTFTIALHFKLIAEDGSSVSFASNVQSVGTATGREMFFEFNHC